MATFLLRPHDGGKDVAVPSGKTTIGRGPFLGVRYEHWTCTASCHIALTVFNCYKIVHHKVSDKRVSRSHAVLEVTDGKLTVLPVSSWLVFVPYLTYENALRWLAKNFGRAILVLSGWLELACNGGSWGESFQQGFRTNPYINYAFNFLTDSFFSLFVYSDSMKWLHTFNVWGCAKILPSFLFNAKNIIYSPAWAGNIIVIPEGLEHRTLEHWNTPENPGTPGTVPEICKTPEHLPKNPEHLPPQKKIK